MKKPAVALAAAAALAIVAPSAVAGGGYDRACGDQVGAIGAPWTNLKADNVACRPARKLADEYVKAPYEDDYKHWVCRERVLGPEDLKVKCSRPKNGGQRLKFFYGA